MKTGAIGKGMSLDGRGKLGKGGGFGRVALGYNYFGFYSWYSGVYQKMYAWGVPYISRKKFNWGSNPRTLKQQNWRAVCAYAWVFWASVSSDFKKKLNIIGEARGISGPNAFMSAWLERPTGYFGKSLFGYSGFGSSYEFDKKF